MTPNPLEAINAELRLARDLLDSATNQEAVHGSSACPEDVLAAVRAAEGHLDDARTQAVTTMKAGGASWSEVGAALGLTRQAAQQRYGA